MISGSKGLLPSYLMVKLRFNSRYVFTNYKIKNILPANSKILKNGIYLIILHATRIPPHLLLSVNGKLFSLGLTGPRIDDDLDLYLRTILKYRIQTLFIELNPPGIFTMNQLHEQITTITMAYPRVEKGIITCLAPVRDFCREVFAADTSKINFVYELLPRLDGMGVIGNCYHWHLERSLAEGSSFRLLTYTMNEVNEHITSLPAYLESC